LGTGSLTHDDLDEAPRVDVHEVAPGETFAVAGATVSVAATDHRPVEPTVAYRVEVDGVRVVLGGDGVPCDSLDALLRGADGYVQTVLREDLVKLVPRQRFQDILDYHSTVEQAAATAERAQVGTLIPRDYVPAPPLGQYDEWRALASGFSGEVVLGDDLTTVTLTSRD
jgi:ribonuclease Z